MKILTEKQQRIYDFIKEYIEKNSYSPTIRQIGKEFGYKSTSTVHAYIKQIERKGYIEIVGVRAMKVLK